MTRSKKNLIIEYFVKIIASLLVFALAVVFIKDIQSYAANKSRRQAYRSVYDHVFEGRGDTMNMFSEIQSNFDNNGLHIFNEVVMAHIIKDDNERYYWYHMRFLSWRTRRLLTMILFPTVVVLFILVILIIPRSKYNLIAGATSHDLKEAMSSLRSMAAKWREADGEQADALSQIDDMEAMTALYVKMASLSDKKADLKLEETNLHSIASSAAREMASLANAKQIEISIADAPKYCNVMADKEFLKLALNSMLMVAAEHSQKQVLVSIGKDHGDVHLSMACDDKTSYKLSYLKRAWKKVTREDKARVEKYGRYGLGLSTVAPMLKAHGARYGCDQAAKGLVLWVSFKRA